MCPYICLPIFLFCYVGAVSVYTFMSGVLLCRWASANNGGAGAEATGALRFVPLELRLFTIKYGFNFIGIYMSVYWLTLLGLYSIISAGIMPARDMMGWVEWGVNKVGGVFGIPLADYLHLSDVNPEAAPLVAAWMLAKPTEPPRLLLSIGITPVISRQIARVVAARGSTPVDGKRALRCASPSIVSCLQLAQLFSAAVPHSIALRAQYADPVPMHEPRGRDDCPGSSCAQESERDRRVGCGAAAGRPHAAGVSERGSIWPVM